MGSIMPFLALLSLPALTASQPCDTTDFSISYDGTSPYFIVSRLNATCSCQQYQATSLTGTTGLSGNLAVNGTALFSNGITVQLQNSSSTSKFLQGVAVGTQTYSDIGASFAFGSGALAYPNGCSTTNASCMIYAGLGAIVGRGATSDFRLDIQDNNGRVNYCWNVFVDSAAGYAYRAITAGESAFRFLTHPGTGFTFFYVPGSNITSAGQVLNNWYSILNMNDAGQVTIGPTGMSTASNVINNPTTITAPSTANTALTVNGAADQYSAVFSGGNGVSIDGKAIVTGTATFSSATASTSSTDGAVIVTGGVGVGGALNVNATVSCQQFQATSLTGTSGINGNLNVNGTALFSNGITVSVQNASTTSTFLQGLAAGTQTTSTIGASFAFGTGVLTYPNGCSTTNASCSIYAGLGTIVGRGATSDFRIQVQDGNGRVNMYWNAFTDMAAGYAHRAITAGESAFRFLTHPGSGFTFYYVPGSNITSAGQLLNNWYQILNMNDAGQVTIGPTGMSTASTVINNPTTITTPATANTALTVNGASGQYSAVFNGGNGVSIVGNTAVTGTAAFTAGTVSSSSSTGAVVVTGGVGIGGALNVGSTIAARGMVTSGSTSTQGGWLATGPVPPGGASSQSAWFVQRDFLQWSSTASGGCAEVHVKTSIKNYYAMYRFVIDGYCFNNALDITSTVGGYLYSSSGNPGTFAIQYTYAIDRAGASTSQYLSSDGSVVIRVTLCNRYYAGFSVSAWQVNPNGMNQPITAAAYNQCVTL